MALKPYATSASVSFSTGVTICSVEVVPDGADLDVKIFGGTDNTGTLKYRILAREKGEFRDFANRGGLQFTGPSYLEFYSGSGTVSITSETEIS